jgi:protein SCO1/2
MQPFDKLRLSRPWRRALLVLLIIAAALLVQGLFRARFVTARAEFHATTYEPVALAPGFTLTDHTGTPLTLAELRGQTVLLFFGYTHCPDVCPLTLTRLRGALDAAGAEPGDARVLMVTVDPARDTPQVLTRYVAAFGSEVTGLTGTGEDLDLIYRQYGVHTAADHSDPAMVTHTSAVFGIDRKGRLRVLLRPDAEQGEFEADVKTLLKL